MGSNKLENIEAIAFFVIITINGIIFSTSQIIFQESLSASLLTAIEISLVAFIVVIAFLILIKPFTNSNLLDISNYLGRTYFKIFDWDSIYYLFYCKMCCFSKKNK